MIYTVIFEKRTLKMGKHDGKQYILLFTRFIIPVLIILYSNGYIMDMYLGNAL